MAMKPSRRLAVLADITPDGCRSGYPASAMGSRPDSPSARVFRYGMLYASLLDPALMESPVARPGPVDRTASAARAGARRTGNSNAHRSGLVAAGLRYTQASAGSCRERLWPYAHNAAVSLFPMVCAGGAWTDDFMFPIHSPARRRETGRDHRGGRAMQTLDF